MKKSSVAGELSVETISDYRSFLELETSWNRLVEEAKIDHPFVSHEWMRTWWESFGSGKTLHTLVVKAGGEPVAIAPLMLSEERIYGLKMRCVQSIHNEHTPRFEFIIGRQSKDAYRAIWRALSEQRELWDALQLGELPADSSALRIMPELAAEDDCLTGTWGSVESPYIEFAGDWDSYLGRLSRNHRKKVRRGLKYLSERGEVALEVVSSGEQVPEALEEALRIEAAAWKEKAGTAICARPEYREFYSKMAKRAAERDWLRLLFLTVSGSRIAMAYGLCYSNSLYVLKAGYEPGYARYSPYNLLCYFVFRDAFEQGLAKYEFLGANEGWKLDWTKKTKPHTWLFVLQKSARARFLHFAKFKLIPRLKRLPVYGFVRKALFGPGFRNGLSVIALCVEVG